MGINKIRCFLLDMDGTFYLGDNVIDGALDFLEILKNQGKDFYFVTNNSSKNSQDYCKKLSAMGCSIVEKKIITSGMATSFYIKSIKPGAKIYLLGTKSLEQHFKEEGFELITEGSPSIINGKHDI